MLTLVPSLELNWLSKYDKDIPLPQVIFAPESLDFYGRRCGGCYHTPRSGEFLYGEQFVPFDRGVILVGAESPENIPAAIAHEWRHHWQFHRGIPFDNQHYDPAEFESWDTFDAAIRNYFRYQRHEMDALLFERRHAPSPANKRNIDLVFRSKLPC